MSADWAKWGRRARDCRGAVGGGRGTTAGQPAVGGRKVGSLPRWESGVAHGKGRGSSK